MAFIAANRIHLGAQAQRDSVAAWYKEHFGLDFGASEYKEGTVMAIGSDSLSVVLFRPSMPTGLAASSQGVFLRWPNARVVLTDSLTEDAEVLVKRGLAVSEEFQASHSTPRERLCTDPLGMSVRIWQMPTGY